MAVPALETQDQELSTDPDRSGMRWRVAPESDDSGDFDPSAARRSAEQSRQVRRRRAAAVVAALSLAALALSWLGSSSWLGGIAMASLDAAVLVVAVGVMRGRFTAKL
jgi:hypothetical protein